MDIYSQITFGCKTIDAEIPTTYLTHRNCSQPKSIEKTSYNHTKIPDIIVPVNIQEYKTLFPNNSLYFPRFEWISKHWNRIQKRFNKHRIKEGNRYNTLYKLITYVVFNAHICNALFNTSFKVSDVDKKVEQLIFETFDNPNTFLKETKKTILSSTYRIFNEILESIQNNGLINTYLTYCKKFNQKINFSYNSNQISFKKLFDSIITDLNMIKNHKERMEFLYKVSNFNKDLFKSLRTCYRKNKHLLINCIDDGNFKISKYILLKLQYKETNEEVSINSIKEQIYCIKNKIKYTFKQIKTNFSFVTNNYISPILLQLHNRLQIRNKVKNKTITLDDLKSSNMVYIC